MAAGWINCRMTPTANTPTTSSGRPTTDTLGQLPGYSAIHFVDASVLPTLPGKPHTLTVMANASRIASSAAKLD
jgi:hypothetical protein